MPGFENKRKRRGARGQAFLAGVSMGLSLWLSACADPPDGGRFEIQRVEPSWSNGTLLIRIEQSLEFSREARNALDHGVPLTVSVELILRESVNQTRVGGGIRGYEIRYLPLSQHYQVTTLDAGTVRTFPRLRHALGELARIETRFETGVLPEGDYELLARSSIDRNRMPSPMRLPALFSSDWAHESAWTSWPLAIRPAA